MTASSSIRPRSIVFLGTAHDNGGSSILASNLAEEMRAAGHHIEEWYLFGSKEIAHPPTARIFVPHERSRSPLRLLTLFVRVVMALRASRADAVFGFQSLANVLAGVGGRLAGIPNRIATHHLPVKRLNPTLTFIDRIIGRLGFYTRMIACANSVAETYAGNGPAYMRRLIVVANGQRKPVAVPRDQARRELGLPAGGIVIGQIGRLDVQKDQPFTVDLLRDLPSATLLLVGSGPDLPLVLKAVADAGLENRVHFVPAIDHARIGLFYSAVDAVVFPSRFEGLSLAAIEAVHFGAPLLCSDIPSFRELFQASPFLSAQLLIPPRDRRAWLERIGATLGDEQLRAQIVSELRRLSPAFGFDTMAKRYLQALE